MTDKVYSEKKYILVRVSELQLQAAARENHGSIMLTGETTKNNIVIMQGERLDAFMTATVACVLDILRAFPKADFSFH